jgi:hypothetical protein
VSTLEISVASLEKHAGFDGFVANRRLQNARRCKTARADADASLAAFFLTMAERQDLA